MQDILARFHEVLDDDYGRGETSVFCEMLFEAFLGWNRVRLLAGTRETIDQSDLLRFHWALEDLRRGRPVQHIIGYTDFCGCRIEVNPDVLIPRPETEEMVRWIVGSGLQDRCVEGMKVLDLCTGSGCIAIALKRAFPEAEAVAVDVSEPALATARRNAGNNGADVRFVQGDVLRGLDGLGGVYGLIVSNPPYVRESERGAMRRNVTDYEPGLALYVPDEDPLRFYRTIAVIAERVLDATGMLVVEIHEEFAEAVCTLLRERGLKSDVHYDSWGMPRWVSAVV